jgi:WD40 repeat protein
VTNVRFSHDDRKLVSVGGADTSVMIWTHNAGSREPVSDETSQSGDIPVMTSSGFSSEDSDTDSEEEGTANNYIMMM